MLWGRETGMPWTGWPMPHDAHGTPAMHDTPVYTGCATWAAEGSRWHAFTASVAPLADETKRARRVRHGDGTTTVAQTGGMAAGIRRTDTRRASRSSRSRGTRGRCELPAPGDPSLRRLGACCRRG